MAVLIGHSSQDERGKTKGGLAGDQTGKEVCTRNWYDKGWDAVLRPINSVIAENSARICEQICACNRVGYDQNQRNSLWNEYLKTLRCIPIKNVECDCSSFMTYCAILGGANIEYGSNAPTTSTMIAKFSANGSYTVLTDKKYTDSSDYLKRGDILVKKGSHTVMVLSDGAKASESVAKKSIVIPKPTIRKGDRGENVKQLQTTLNTLFAYGLVADGIFGTKTFDALSDSQKVLKKSGYYTSTIDGIYGKGNYNAFINYAKAKGYTVQ